MCNWEDVERLYDAVGLGPQVQSTASRAAVPVYRGGLQVGKATSTTWSPTLKKMIALASLNREHAAAGTELQMELTVEAVRHKVRATSRETAIFQSASEDGDADSVKIFALGGNNFESYRVRVTTGACPRLSRDFACHLNSIFRRLILPFILAEPERDYCECKIPAAMRLRRSVRRWRELRT